MIYFDNAATTLYKPPGVAEAVSVAVGSLGNAGRGAHGVSLDAARMIYGVREKLCRLFNAEDPTRIAFTSGGTESLNIAIKGIAGPGDHLITTVAEHNSVLRPAYEMQAAGTELTVIPCDDLGRVDPQEIERNMRANTKAVICTHGSNMTGNIPDMERIGAITSQHGASLIADASQAAGECMIDVQKSSIDVLCFTGHKGLFGPQGTGGIYVREGVELRPLKTGGSGVHSFSRTHPVEMPAALEAGTLNSHGIAGLDAALDWILETGVDEISRKTRSLAGRFCESLKEIPQIKVYGDLCMKRRLPVVSLNIGETDSSYVSDVLYRDFGIATRPGAHCAPLMHETFGTETRGAVRFSFSYFNNEDEVDEAIRALRKISGEEMM